MGLLDEIKDIQEKDWGSIDAIVVFDKESLIWLFVVIVLSAASIMALKRTIEK